MQLLSLLFAYQFCNPNLNLDFAALLGVDMQFILNWLLSLSTRGHSAYSRIRIHR